MAYDIAMPGYNTYNSNTIRFWSAKPFCEFDVVHFNEGNYYAAIEDRQKADQITKVLCYRDCTNEMIENRIKQEYFFSAATIKDIVVNFKKLNKDWDKFP